MLEIGKKNVYTIATYTHTSRWNENFPKSLLVNGMCDTYDSSGFPCNNLMTKETIYITYYMRVHVTSVEDFYWSFIHILCVWMKVYRVNIESNSGENYNLQWFYSTDVLLDFRCHILLITVSSICADDDSQNHFHAAKFLELQIAYFTSITSISAHLDTGISDFLLKWKLDKPNSAKWKFHSNERWSNESVQ